MTTVLIFMQQHTHWFIGIAVLVAIGGLWITIHEIRFRVERRKVVQANLRRIMQEEKQLELEYHPTDVLFFIDADTDICLFTGTPSEIYEYLLQRPFYGRYDVYNNVTSKRVSTAQFLAKWESEMAA